ncbi:NHLP family bacteriocin export ABC transporter peptidase/permease/ATPase subunit [Catenovulum sediminis]|uniref:NHLP family bacteriocin export ABC transporter peptidase/permease/ATPase subunit n=1 Tax=Catenovulum sediminis TaxID=1740262 RepID=A0ABV1RIU9_9ALTE
MSEENKSKHFNIPRKRTPTVLQMEAVECGAAALGIIMRYYKKFVPLEELRVACGVSRDGSKASHVVKAARAYGLKAKGFRLEPQKLVEKRFPVIVFWNFNHFLVLEGINGDTVYLNDPATGPRTVTFDEFDQSYTGICLEISPDEHFVADGKPPSMLLGLIRRLDHTWFSVAFLFLVGLSLVIPGLVVPVFNKIFIDNILIGQQNDWFTPLIWMMIATAIVVGVLNWIKEYYLIRLQNKISVAESVKFLWHILHLPVLFFNQRSPGDIASRLSINSVIAQLMSREFISMLLDMVAVLFFGMLLLFYNVKLTIVGCCIIALNILYLRFTSRKNQDMNMRSQQDSGKLAGTSMNGLLSIESLKASGRENDFFAQWSGYFAKVFNANQNIRTRQAFLNTLPVFLTAVNTALIIGIGGLYVMNGELTLGELAAFQALMTAFIAPVNNLVGLGAQLQTLSGSMVRVDDVLKYEQDPLLAHYKPSPEQNHSPRLNGYLDIKNLTFGYSKVEPPIINNFNLSIKPGGRVALVGTSGCGKSTVSKLVIGLYQPWEGEILFDGKSRTELSRVQIVNSIAMVDQKISVFEGTIRDSLTLWDRSIPDSVIIQACKDAEIHDVIASRDGAYDSLIREGGGNFSGGQLQRLEIARSLIRQPSILILDEATSALDPTTEKKIDNNLRKRGCTCLIIAHRLSTIRDCDEIIVLKDGEISERGTHESLTTQPGLYFDMVNAE